MDMRDYVVVTPCKNEGENLPKLAKSIINQTIKPKIWLIFNDGSTDTTIKILNDLIYKYDWIHIINGENHVRDLSFHYAEIVNTTINSLFDMGNNLNISFGYVALIDADMILDLDFFEKIIEQFKRNPKLGIASGSVGYRYGDKIVVKKVRDDLPNGGLRVWRKKCLIDTGGFPRSYSADAVSNVLAIMNGWEIKNYYDIIGIQTRETSSAEGLFKGYTMRGKSDYYRDYNFIYVLLKFIKYISKPPFFVGFPYIYGYLLGIVKIREKIPLLKIREYYKKKHIILLKYYISKI